jgi:glycine/D-amino acid oxidase-like deaminating enzyme
MLGRAIEFLPGLRNLSAVRAWTGFRAATPDKLPLIGPAALAESTSTHERLFLRRATKA